MLKNPLLKSGVPLLILILAGIFVMRYQKTANFQPKSFIAPTPTPTPIQESEVHSSDGTMKLIMKNGSFFIADISGKNQRLLFTKTVELEKKMSLPQNSFSPDNKYVYLEESEGNSLNALVLKASGEPFINNQPYLDVVVLLATSKPEYRLTHVTGWASPQFLQMRLVKGDSTKNLSYWFDVESRTFLQLANR